VGLMVQDLYRILTEPETNMIKQQQLLMKTEDIDLVFTSEAIHELAAVAAEVQTTDRVSPQISLSLLVRIWSGEIARD
jgi:ATP-dependent protease HslVU (ClpYQ) ATPase subunit